MQPLFATNRSLLRLNDRRLPKRSGWGASDHSLNQRLAAATLLHRSESDYHLRTMKPLSKLVFVLVMVMAATLALDAEDNQFKVATLSSRPDMISGGDVLVRIDLPGNTEKAVVRLNGQDVSSR